MTLLNNLLSPVMINVIGWTLVHGIWQGALIAVAGFLLMVIFRKSSADTRYLIGVSLLLLMLVVSLVTAQLIFRSETAHRIAAAGIHAGGAGETAEITDHGLWIGIKVFFNSGLPLIVSAWILGALFFFMKFVSGILVNQRLRHHHSREVNGFWKRRVDILAAMLNVRRKIMLKETLVARVPMVIGHLKPVILFPVGMLTQMPPGQVETLIVHELVHILRRDYLVNLLQNLTDILYFHHPGIRWISSQIRVERENCCDDLTVSTMGNRLTYARALTRVGENSLEVSRKFAVAASGKPFTLLNRIRRLYPMNPEPKYKDGMISLLTMAIFAVFLVAATAASGHMFASPPAEQTGENDTAKQDTIRTMQKRYQELATRESRLSDTEKKEMEMIALKLKSLKKEEEKQKVLYIKEELARLQEKAKLSDQEEKKRRKYLQLVSEYEHQLKLRHLKETYKKLKIREKELSAEEQKKLQAISEKLKAVEEREKERQTELMEKEKALRVYYEELKAREAELNKEEKAKLGELALRLKEMQAGAAEARLARKEKTLALKQEYLHLRKLEKRTAEQEEKLKKIQHYMQEIKMRYQELKEKREALQQAAQALESKEKLTKKEKFELQRLKRDLERVQQEIAEY